MNNPHITIASITAALVASFALSACNRTDDGRTAGERVDSTVAKVEQKTESAGQEIKQEAKEAGDKVANAAADAAITTQINAELAKDDALKATKINVDTEQGRVVLRGTAPNAEARERATRIAANIKGVGSVENFLTVDASS
jgi:osmotically-inducible protein OsmY